jgi:nanoRNase/pAp phosphatase (c-di-AMP/oligoRNAs hydrolase)
MSKQYKAFKEELTKPDINLVGIFIHSNPDPDAIASAWGLTKFINCISPDTKCNIFYTGEISHSQNKTLVNTLGITMINIDSDDYDFNTDLNISVDTTPERSMPESLKCYLTIDHHRNDSKRSKYCDIRDVGSTCSIVWDYLQKSNIQLDVNDDFDSNVATALLIGIKTDTGDLISENVRNLDFDAYKNLIGLVNRRSLSSIVNYSIPNYHFKLRSQLDDECNYKKHNSVFVGGIGYISQSKRDSLPILAEERARLEGIDTSFVFAIVENNIEVSVRSVGTSVDVNSICKRIFGADNGGGKYGAGAAKIPMGFFDITDSPDEVKTVIWNSLKELVFDKVFKVME